MAHNRIGRGSGSAGWYLVGGLLVVIGVLFLLSQFGVFELDLNWGLVWPVIVIATGVVFLVQDARSHLWWAPFLIVMGVVFLLIELGVVPEGAARSLWPIALVLVGLAFIASALLRSRARRATVDGEAGVDPAVAADRGVVASDSPHQQH